MRAMQQTVPQLDHLPRQDAAAPAHGDGFDWTAQLRLAVVLSLAVAIAAVGLAGRVPDQVIVIGAMVVASVPAWRRVGVPAR